jgi:hypothetical protein
MTVSLEWLERICAALNVEPRALFGNDDALMFREAVKQIRREARIIRMDGQTFVEQLDAFLERSGG